MKACCDSAALRERGFTDKDAWGIGAITAPVRLSNHMANPASMRPNNDSGLMGRVPRRKPAVAA